MRSPGLIQVFEQLHLMKLGAARDRSHAAWRLVTIAITAKDATFSYRLDRNKLRQARLREGRYLLRTNLVEEEPAKLWSHYLLLMAVERTSRAIWRSGHLAWLHGYTFPAYGGKRNTYH